jgi:peptidyl-prolyl cis-trans isomerase B (cyclophilin B)
VDTTETRAAQHRITDAAAIETEITETPGAGSSRAALAGAVVAVLAMAAGIWGLTALGRSVTRPKAGPPIVPAAAPASPAEKGCEWVAAAGNNPDAKDVGTPPATGEPRTGTAEMVLHTSLGPIAITIDLARTPCAAASFRYLASTKFFDGSHCVRLVTQGLHLLQCGDPTGTRRGGPRYVYASENLPTAGPDGSAVYGRAVVGIANLSGNPVSNGSQFFINLDDNQLAPDYTQLGIVTAGMSIVDKIGRGGTDNAFGTGDGHPKVAMTINSVTFSTAG